MTDFLFNFYRRYISPIFGWGCCRYSPTCSGYMHQAVKRFGLLRGGLLGLGRLLSCHPYSSRDFDDPVPEVFTWHAVFGYKNEQSKQSCE